MFNVGDVVVLTSSEGSSLPSGTVCTVLEVFSHLIKVDTPFGTYSYLYANRFKKYITKEERFVISKNRVETRHLKKKV